jgi:pimeloyl-ACP methyl ester carboxylesterase
LIATDGPPTGTGIPFHGVLRTNGISMHIAEQGDGPLVVLCHGFPELWYSWRHQLTALGDAGYHAVAPDQRGYGRTDRPEAVEAYDIVHLTADLTGLLDALGEQRAVFVGHDWGAMLVWQLALLAPERVAGLVAMSVPFVPRTPVPFTEVMRAFAGDRFLYMLYFQEVGPADEELGGDPRRSLLKVLWSAAGERGGAFRPQAEPGAGWLDRMPEPEGLPPWLGEEDLDLYVSEFERTGFTGPINWYRNFDRNWELTPNLAGARVEAPALFIAGERDPVLRMSPPQIMDGWVPDLRGTLILPGAGHWIQQERPDEVNAALLEFLAAIDW